MLERIFAVFGGEAKYAFIALTFFAVFFLGCTIYFGCTVSWICFEVKMCGCFAGALACLALLAYFKWQEDKKK